MSSIILNPFQLLELNVISAQDLATVARSMRTYAVAWVHPDRKLSTRVDSNGRNNPTWNDKFVFRVDDEFLTSDTSGVMIEIYAVHWFKDVLVGRVRILVGNLVPPPSRPFRRQHQHGMRFAALQVRRPSGRPQGILNIGVAVLDSSMRSMPLYTQLSTSAVGYLELMGEQNLGHNNHNHHPQQQQKDQQEVDQKKQQPKEILPTAAPKPELRRTKSDTSSIHGVKTLKRNLSFKMMPNSVINASEATSSIQLHGKKGSSSLPSSMVNAPASASVSVSALAFASPGRKGRKGKVTSTPTAGNEESEVGTPANPNAQAANKSKWVQKGEIVMVNPSTLTANKKWVQKPEVAALSPNNNPVANKQSRWVSSAAASPNNMIVPTNKLSNLAPKNLALDFEATPAKPGKLYITESELGPSPSEVAAAVAAKMKHRVPPHQLMINDGESSAVGAWSLVESEEGLQSKLERWRKELPPVYDHRGEYSTVLPSIVNDNAASKLSSDTRVVTKRRHARRHTIGGPPRGGGGGGGLFSCVSNICGCECSIVCGQGSSAVDR